MNIYIKIRNLQNKDQASLTSIVSAVDISKILKAWKGMKIIALLSNQISRSKLLLTKREKKKLMTQIFS